MNRLKGSLFYLSGSMDNSPDGGVGWREELSPILKNMGIGVLNPCSKPCFDNKEDNNFRKQIQSLKDLGDFNQVKNFMKDIVGYDLRMCDLSHAIIISIDPEIHMTGSYWEICYGVQQHKPILVWCPSGLNKIPNWLFGVLDYNEFFVEIKDLVQYLQKIDSGATELNRKWKFFDFSKIF